MAQKSGDEWSDGRTESAFALRDLVEIKSLQAIARLKANKPQKTK